MAIRIIGGEHRGRLINMPKGARLRPTKDKVREAVFNVIMEKVQGSHVLDLYAGSGAWGIEALSRGARSSIFVDNNIYCVRTIKSNLSTLYKTADFTQVIKLEAVKAISKFENEEKRFDIIFLDPPYYKDLAKNSLLKIASCDILQKHAFVIAEHFKKDLLPAETGALRLFKEKRYGDTIISFYSNG